MQLTAVAVSPTFEILFESSVHFDTDLPSYHTQGGVHIKPNNR
jgi:hypothetical protein